MVLNVLVVAYLLAWGAAAHLAFLDVDLPEVHGTVQAATYDPVAAWGEMDADVLAGVAKSEDPDAADAVMWTVLNRAARSGRSVEREAASGRAYGWWVGRRWSSRPDREQLADLRGLAMRVLGGTTPDPTDGATHFHRECTTAPPWAPRRSQWRTEGSHHFYKERTR